MSAKSPASDFSVEDEHCIFCPSSLDLTDEHVFPAALGSEDVVPRGSCSRCNGAFNTRFEVEFNNGFKHLCYLLKIGNREAKIPSLDAVTVIDGAKLNLVLHPDGGFTMQDKKEESVLETGEKVTHYLLFSEERKQRLRERAERRGQRLEGIEGNGKPIIFEPQSFMSLEFIGTPVALRSATKVALMAVAKVIGRVFASSPCFGRAKRFLMGFDEATARLFVNKNFAKNMHSGPHQHIVQVYCNGQEHSIYATVIFFGGLSYLVELSRTYEGADYGFTYGYDALQRQPAIVLPSKFDAERLAIHDVRFGNTRFDDVFEMAEHWATYIQAAAREEITPVERPQSADEGLT
jgi:hypothetical protein